MKILEILRGFRQYSTLSMMRSLFAGFILSGGKGVTTGHVKLCGFEPKIVNQEDGTVV